ncbi:hybrid sensor histidine kinase/response regulator [Enterovibrio norvegicus FF-454]|uniref:histidine kinase n=1 Tax=Enterovibrio norvegicus FF-454 TaxID=1185651 RepID=A0A1E5BZB3_9GAMM|nr:hybrid sensor histidine kinase/response regulator [Enterovibrio norvegicus]OEE58598.1 hybrid sensor histidine kinase/response regulator [Enterovibrio norvegicus FF-454]
MEAAFRKVYQYAEPNLTLVSWMGLIGFPAYYFIWQYIYPQAYENLPLRLFCCLFFVIVLVRNKLSPVLKERMHWFYQIAISIVLPFFFFYMLLMNNWSTVWLLSFMAAIFLHILLVHITWVMFAQTLAGITMATICAWAEKGYHLAFSMDWTYMPVFLFIYLFGNLFFFRNQQEHETKVSIAKVFGAGIAHEMRNPLSGLCSSIDLIRLTIPDPKDSNNRVYQLREEDVLLLREISDDAMNIIRAGNETIDLLLTSIDENRVSRSTFKKHAVKNVLQHAVDSFGFRSATDKTAITIRNTDTFDFLGSDTLLKYVIYNLFKNAFHHRIGEDFAIDLMVGVGDRENRIIVRDNGQGISSDILDLIFEDFYTTGRTGNYGLGLPFCRKVMRSFGGEISCDSKAGEWTAFTLTFPTLDSSIAQDIKHNLIKLKSMLMVTNDADLVRRTAKISKKMGFNLQTIDVLHVLKKPEFDFEYDVIIVDLESVGTNGDVLGHIEPLLSFTEAKIVYLHNSSSTGHQSHAVYNPTWIEGLAWRLNTPMVIEQLFFDTVDASIPNKRSQTPSNTETQTIMVVDDSESLRQMTSIVLEKQGFNVIQCANGHNAIAMLKQDKQHVDLILMDIEMPVMDGVETSRRIRSSLQAYADVPIIAHTGDNSRPTLERITSSGMTDFIIKPSEQQQLRDKITTWLS